MPRMSKRFKYKSRQTVRIKMRSVLMVSALAAGFLTGAVLLIVQLFENKVSVAGSDPMVVADIEVFQDTIPVLKGTSMQVVLGIKVQTKGRSHHLNFSGITVSARGTTRPFESYASNARLWSTGNDDFFIPVNQIGATISEIREENFRLDGKQALLPGDNYFWLTFDINKVAGSITTMIDAECVAVHIGTLTHDPAISAPPGAKRILNNTPYYSTGSGDISSLDSWNASRDGSGKRPSNFNLSTATFHIQSGHILRNDLNACLTYLVIERNGVLISASDIRSERVEIHGGGTLVQEKNISNYEGTSSLVINNGGNYIHNNTGAIPGKTKKFSPHSNVVFNNYGTVTFQEKIQWGNVIIESRSASSIDFMNCFHTIKGNFEIRATGNQNYLYSTLDDTINIGGNLVINGGGFVLTPAKNQMVLNVNKEFILKSGWFSDALPGKISKGNVTFYPGNKVYFKSGTFHMTAKNSHIYLREEFITWIQDTASLTLPDVTVMPGCTLRLSGRETGRLAENKNFVVSSTAMLDCGTTSLTGEGNFRLQEYATIATGHLNGIHSENSEGCIQTKSRYFSSSADYIFNGAGSPQTSGLFTTIPLANTVNQLTIKKSDASGVLILQQDLTITGRLIKERGSINKNSHKLETGEMVTATATPSLQTQ